jgi:hypothetical protein
MRIDEAGGDGVLQLDVTVSAFGRHIGFSATASITPSG